MEFRWEKDTDKLLHQTSSSDTPQCATNEWFLCKFSCSYLNYIHGRTWVWRIHRHVVAWHLKSVFGNKYVMKNFRWPCLAKNFHVLKFAESFSQPLYEIRKINSMILRSSISHYFSNWMFLKKVNLENFYC
jgi:hypothetical protein